MLGAAQSEKCMMGGGGDRGIFWLHYIFFLLHRVWRNFFTAIALHGIFFKTLITVYKHNVSSVVREQAYRNIDCKASLRLAAYNNSIVCFLMSINRVGENITPLPFKNKKRTNLLFERSNLIGPLVY